MLNITGLNQFYGGSHILRNVTMEVPKGSLTVVLGRNGVGKTTLLRCLMGLVRAKSGTIAWAGQALETLPPHARVAHGLGYVPQGREIFARLSVEENLLVGAASRKSVSQVPDRIYSLFPVLGEMRKRRGGDLSGGQQQLVGIARAVVANPRIILADEPTGNLHSAQGKEIMDMFKRLNDEGTTIVQVTHSEANAAYGSRVIHLRDGWIVEE